MSAITPFHPGEQKAQQRMGVREQIEAFARQMIRPFMPDQHRAFYADLPFMVAAARDASGRPWATLLAGTPGFVTAPDAQSLRIRARPVAGDALDDSLAAGADLGLLGIEFASRRRNRVNGRIAAGADDELWMTVDQSFGNCPQHIRPREWRPAPARQRTVARRYDRLTPDQIGWIERADTFFIASGYRAGDASHFGMDASHRGGTPGFVEVLDEHTLVWPDYAGNHHYNTIGNLLLDAGIGLLFVDFEHGHLLQLSGRATIDWDSAEVAKTPGAHRRVTVALEAVVELRDALPIRWYAGGEAIRSLRVVAKRRESTDVMSFLLRARDGGELAGFAPGQHLPIEVAIPGQPRRVTRTYSLSAPANGQSYRLTVKREAQGLVSRFLHDRLQEGDTLSARPPAGDFTLRPGVRPVVLISAGTGITPMAAMLGALDHSGEQRRVWFIHGARDGDHHPLAREVRRIVAGNDRIHSYTAYSRPRAQDVQGRDFDRHGRIDVDWIGTLLPDLDGDFYLCGPAAFMARLHGDLLARGVADDHIYSETFGPGG